MAGAAISLAGIALTIVAYFVGYYVGRVDARLEAVSRDAKAIGARLEEIHV